MDSRSTFLHRHGGFKRDVGEGQWLGVTEVPLYGSVRAGPSAGFARREAMHPCFQEKRRDTDVLAVPKPTQVGGCKDTQARGRNLVKELGNMTP